MSSLSQHPAPPSPEVAPTKLGHSIADADCPVRDFTTSEVIRVEKLSYRDFVHDFRNRRRPVVITDATLDWAARSWTPDELQRRAGHRELEIRTESGSELWRLEELVELIKASTNDSPAPYARNVNLERDLPELWADVQPRLKYATPDWKSSSLLPRDFVFPNGLEELFFGGEGNAFPRLHIDYWGMDGFVSQFYGRKEFILLGPEQTPFLYPTDDELSSSITDINGVDLDMYPRFKQARPIRLTLNPGETLYNPNGFWHTTVMQEVSMTVITATWHSANWKTFCQQYRQRGKTRGVQKACVLAWLIAVGSVLGVRDHLFAPAETL
jgi:histone arginine demethylase JMJD6